MREMLTDCVELFIFIFWSLRVESPSDVARPIVGHTSDQQYKYSYSAGTVPGGAAAK